MSKIEWTTRDHVVIGKHRIACVPNLKDGYNQGSGIKYDSKIKLALKCFVYPLIKLRNDLVVDGFIEAEVGKLIKKLQD